MGVLVLMLLVTFVFFDPNTSGWPPECRGAGHESGVTWKYGRGISLFPPGLTCEYTNLSTGEKVVEPPATSIGVLVVAAILVSAGVYVAARKPSSTRSQ